MTTCARAGDASLPASSNRSQPTKASGRFSVAGTFTRERGGPSRPDGETALAARYAGTLRDTTLTMTVTLTETREAIGVYTLTRGRKPRIVRCQ